MGICIAATMGESLGASCGGMLTDWLDGDSASDLILNHSFSESEIIRDMGVYLARVHGISVPSFGPIGEPGRPSFSESLEALRIVIELDLPCDGVDPLITLGSACIPLTTGTATGIINDSNYVLGDTLPGIFDNPPQTATGVPVDLAEPRLTSGLELVGQLPFFDSTIGDLQLGLELVCR